MPRFAPAALCAAFLVLRPPPAAALDEPMDAASRLAARGALAAAESAYDAILAAEPARRDARLGRAHVRAFRGSFRASAHDYEEILAAAPDDVDALVGLGHTLAWAGAFATAEERFRRVLELSPAHPEAMKGLAWVALWRGDAFEASRRFEAAARERPGDAELEAGRGESLRRAGLRPQAHAAFAHALELAPGRDDARSGLDSTRAPPSRLDAIVLGGVTATAGHAQPGVRFAELALSRAPRVRAWLQYDDSLGLDNLALARRGALAPALYAGGLAGWGEAQVTRLEAGWRTVDGRGQALLRGEQVVGLGGGWHAKAGAWTAVRSGQVEAIGHAAISLPVSGSLRLEPALLVARGAPPGDRDARLLLGGEWRAAQGLELGGGLAAGWSFGRDGAAGSAFARASLPLRGTARALLLARHDRPSSGAPVSVVAAGLSFTFGVAP